jgi:hypothetical protein
VPQAKTSWTDTEVYDYQAKMGTVSLASAVKAYDWMATKDLHNREVGHPNPAVTTPNMTATTVIAVKLATDVADATLDEIEVIRGIAVDRGLMHVMVSEEATLEQAIYEARELAAHAADDTAARLADEQGE